MPKIEYNIFGINDPAINAIDSINATDSNLVDSFEIKNVFIPTENFVELNFFSLQNNLLLSEGNYTNYKVLQDGQSAGREGACVISVDVLADVKAYNYDLADVRVVYNFLNNIYSNINRSDLLYLENISSDRTEVRLMSTILSDEDIQTLTSNFKTKLESAAYSTDFSLYSGNNNYITAINIDTQDYNGKKAVIVKLYQPLPATVQLKDRFTIVEKLCDSPAYEVDVTITPDPPVIPTLRSPNFTIEVDEQSTEPSQYFNYNELFSFPVNNTYRELNSLFNEKGAELSIDYSDYSNFINFSSAEERIRNFKYKLQLIESYQTSLDAINDNLTNYTGTGVQGSRDYFEGLIKGVLDNFDHYERHLYYESGSTSWPKGNDTRPYINVGSTTGAGINWFNSNVASGSNYDLTNPDILINSIPSYLKEDPNNDPYLLFIHMVGQHFDNLWLYTDAVSKKYNADNRLNRGVPKDLVEDLLKNFGVKLYTSNYSTQDLFKYFTATSYQVDGVEPNLDPIITGSNYPISQKSYQQEIYKRIYHNLPLLMKSKGTERGLRALINCFGIPSDTLKIRLYGGQSSEDLPFFGGRQSFTGSLDKVRLNNTGSIVAGDTVSQYTSIFKLDNYFTQDLHNIEVGFSPTHNVDEYIISQSAVLFPDTPFDIDDYIGDPREIASNTYFALRDYADTIFNGVNSYDLKDFVRFIKFFDNVIFRIVRDFIPARTVADTGIIIKPHLLERSKYEAPVMSWTQPEYTGSINTAFISGSDGGVYKSFATGSLTGSLVTSYIERVITPSGTIVHSWTDSNNNTVYVRSHEEARFDGQLSGSHIVVSNGELNDENPYKTLDYKDIIYDIRFIKEVPANACLIQSLGSSTNPYVIRPTENPYDLSSLFLNAPLAAFDFTVDGSSGFRDPGAYNFDFSFGNQYSATTIIATSGSCTATTVGIKVTCDVTLNLANIPEEFVYLDREYDLTSWYFQNSNSANTIYVNGVALTSGQAQEYNFSGNEGDLVDVKFQDNVDSTCKIERTFTLAGCSLDYVNPPIVEDFTPGSITRQYFNVPSCFAGTKPSTIYKVLFNYVPASGPNSGSLQSYGPVDIATVNSNGQPIVESQGNGSEFYRVILEEVYPGLVNTLNAVGVNGDAVESIAFTARNSNQCTAGTPNFIVPTTGGATPRVAIELGYNPLIGNISCNEPAEYRTVYVDPPNPGPLGVILNGVNIYSDAIGTFAEAGFYSFWQNGYPAAQKYRKWIGNSWEGLPVQCPAP